MKKLLFILLWMPALFCLAQDSASVHPSKNNSRKWLIGGLSAAGYAGSLVVLNEAWYKTYPKTGFHTFNDAGEWMQVDKVGHAWTAYNTSKATTALWRWAGFDGKDKNKAVWLGSLSGFTYLTVIELLDAHSANWGWSWPDIGANLFGTGLFAGQEFLWDEQRIHFKFSAHRKNYPPDLKQRAGQLYGAGLAERLLKDYNAQSYWLSFNLAALAPDLRLPPWLSLSVGYGAEGIYGGFDNIAYDKNGNLVFDRRDIRRYRQWYLAPDVDLSRIRTKSRLLRTVLSTLNVLKFPAPSLELSNNKLKLRAVVF